MIVSKKGKKYYYYINIASPYLFEEETIKYIDFDLDYRIPDAKKTQINLLDQDEFNEHSVKYQYPPKLIEKIKLIQQEVLEKFKRKEFDQYLNYDLIYYQTNKDENG
jgi:protein associated with RNAse G/E